jgi:methanogenic corrinoid protein MtbC1
VDPAHLQAAEALEAVARAVAEWTVDQIHTDDPDMEIRYGGDSRRMWRHEVQSRVAHLVEALAADRSAIFTAHASWSRAAFMARDMGEQDVERSLHALKQVVRENLPADIVRRAEPMIDAALSETKNKVMPPPSELDRLADEGTLSRLYLLELLQRDREKAERIVREQLEGGATLAEILTRIISPAMQEIGRMWHMQEASIADEHYCTAATQAIMARLRGQARRKPANGLVAVACSAGGDMHELGIRMVSDLLDVEGWHVECLGANMPSHEVAAVAGAQPHRGPADVIAVSAGTPLAIRSVAHLIRTVKEEGQAPDAAFMVGGMPFNMVPDLWKVVGADGFAASATDAPLVAADLARSRRSHARS